MTARLKKSWALSIVAILILIAGCQKSTDRAPPFDADKVYTGADGRAYRLERLEKKPNGYAWVNKTMLRYYPNGFYEVEKEDDAYFYVRQYVPIKVNPVAEAVAVPTEISPPASDIFSWKAFDEGLPRSGQWRENFAVADMNGDGFPDLVFAPARKTLRSPAIFLGDGKGKWTPWTKASYPAVPYDYGGAAVGDINGDGKPDIALGMHLLGIAALTGDGKGQFSDDSDGLPRRKGSAPPKFSSRQAFIYDWNGDGNKAIVALNERMGQAPDGLRDGVSVFLRHGKSWDLVPSEVPLQSAVLMTLDASAKKLAVLSASASSGSIKVSERKAGQWNIHDVEGFPKTAQLTAFAMVDNHDSADTSTFAVAYRTYAQSVPWTHIDLIRQHENQWQRVPLSARHDASGVHALTFAKLRPGAFQDIVVLDESGEIEILRQVDADHYTHDQSVPVPTWRAGCQGAGLQAADLDKDGIDEVVASFSGEASVLTGATECVSGGGIQAFKISATH